MIGLSQTMGYSIRVLNCLSTSARGSVTIARLADCSRVPKAYLAKIVNTLACGGIVCAKRGVGGGISLARDSREINLMEVVEIIDGKKWISPCLLGLDDCEGFADCPTHDFWIEEQARIENELRRITLRDVVEFEERRRRPATVGACCD